MKNVEIELENEAKDQVTESQNCIVNNVQAHVEPSCEPIKDALTKIRPQGLQNLVAIPAEGGSPKGHTFEMPTQAAQAADWALSQNQSGMNLYFTVNPVKSSISKKPVKEDIEAAEYAHVDIDPDVSSGYDEGRRCLLEEELPRLEGFEPRPTLIVDTGNGLGAFWRLAETEIVEAEQVNQQLIAQFGGDAGTWNVDRLMRLPGTLNYPSDRKLAKGYPKEPRTSALLQSNGGTCSVDQLAAVLPEPKPVQRQAANSQIAEIKGDSSTLRSLTEEEQKQVNLRLQTALEQSAKLRDRWEGSQEGLTDMSRSGMDFSMTAMLKVRGFTFSETAYLLTERFVHGKGTENTDRDLRRSWERSENSASPGSVRGWVNDLYTTEEAAEQAGLDPVEMAGLDAYSILLRGTEANAEQDFKELEAEIVRQAHKRALEQMNEQFAKTMIGGKVAVIREFTDPTFATPTYAVMVPAQLEQWYKGIAAYRVKGSVVSRTNLGKDWLDWYGQRRYQRMTFEPGPVQEDTYNSWTGFPVEPAEGDWSLMRQFIREGLCDGNEEHYEWLLDWMAVGLQQPAVRYGVATVLRGEKGVGKGQFAKWYGKLFGNHYLHLSNTKHLVGNFNAHLERALLVFADELIWGGNQQHEGVLKSLVTEELIPIERKGWDTEMRKNYTRLLVASNEHWVVPAGIGERRWFVLDVSAKFRQDTDFFAALETHMENGGLSAMMHDLLNRDITTNQRVAPSTKALADVAVLGFDDVASWLHESLSAGEFPKPTGIPLGALEGFFSTKETLEAMQNSKEEELCIDRTRGPSLRSEPTSRWPYAVKKDTLYKSFESHAKAHNRYGRVRDRASFFKRLGSLLPSAQEQRPRITGVQERILILPPLEEAREEFKRTSGLDFQFEDAA